jgi:protein-tyrosine-phosphatase
MINLMNVLFICRGNVGRSQAAMSFYNQMNLGHADSAGTLLKYPGLRLVDNGVANNSASKDDCRKSSYKT